MSRHHLPRIWLMTDERLGDALWRALERLPRGAGIVFRHHALPPDTRRALFERVRAVARRRRLVLVLAGTPREAIAWRADGAHGRFPRGYAARRLLRTRAAHHARDLVAARRAECDAAFLSPVYPTRSHPGARVLGVVRFGLLAHAARLPVLALGGVTPARMRALRGSGAAGWGAIDAWMSRG